MKEYEAAEKQEKKVKQNTTLIQNTESVDKSMTDSADRMMESLRKTINISPETLEADQKLKDQQKRIEMYRQRVLSNMPTAYDTERLQRLQSGKNRVVSDLSKKKKDNKISKSQLKQDLKDTQAEVDEINRILNLYDQDKLDKYFIDKKDVDVEALRMKQSFDLMHLLVNENSKSDSKEMKAVKIDVLKLSATLETSKNLPATKANLDEIYAMYETAIKSCEDYLTEKSAFTRTGKKRAAAVRDVWNSIKMESKLLQMATRDPSKISADISIGKLLHMAGDNSVQEGRVKVSENVAESDRSAGATLVQNVFQGQYDFSSSFSSTKIKESTRKTEVAKVLSLKDTLRRFRAGKTQVMDLEIMGMKVRMLQKADNTLYILEDHKRVPLETSAELMISKIERDMMLKPEAYGTEVIGNLLNDYTNEERQITSGEHARIRSNLIEFLMQKLGMTREEFTNVRKTTMADYAQRLVNAPKEQQTAVVNEIKKEIQTSVKSEELINGVELTELMERDAQRKDEIASRVSMYKIQNAAEQNDWSDEEKAVQNLLADFVYPEDTLIMDKNADHPEEFIRTVLLQNTKALAILIREKKGNQDDLMASIMQKMSLDQLFSDRKDSLTDVIAKNIREFCVWFTENNGEYDTTEAVETALKAVLEDKQEKRLTDYLKNMHQSSEQAVKDSCKLLQDDVTKITDNIFAETVSDDEVSLQAIMKNASRSKKGQGKFTKIVLNNYFKRMSPIDQRAMLSSVLRSSGKVQDQFFSNLDLIQEISLRGLKGYESFKANRDYTSNPLTEEEKKQLENYKQEKRRAQIGANYLGGLIRGAGPLFQKMMQGLPEDTLPAEIRLAIKDVKSKLPPMPERVVKSQMNTLIERSGGTITKIDVQKSLGAASVGQTFLCRIHGPKLGKEGKQVVIKLLRPDVQNRMKREEKVMLSCAKETDAGMEETYKGQLTNYRKELDLTTEAQNIQGGEVYNNKFEGVETVKINNLIDSTVNTLVLELAEGKTLDDILLEAEKFRNDVYEELRYKSVDKDGNVEKFDYAELDYRNFEKSAELKNKLIDKANELIKKRDIMADVTKDWVQEAIFGGGYYHADLHAGNIMISEEKGTMIDFGNAAKFNGDQQTAITRMITAAADAEDPDVDLFFKSFNSMLNMDDPKFAEFYTEEKQDEVKAEFERVLRMGGYGEAGERIACALIKAQELGVTLPPEIYNFSQGQLRLQKSINDINAMVQNIKSTIDWIDTTSNRTNNVDIVSYAQNEIDMKKQSGDYDADPGSIVKNYVDMFEDVNREEFTEALLDNTYKQAKPEKGIEGINKRGDFDKQYLGSLASFSENLVTDKTEYRVENATYMRVLQDEETGQEKTVPVNIRYRQVWNDYKKNYADKKGTQEQRDAGSQLIMELVPFDVNLPVFSSFGGSMYLSVEMLDALENMDDEKFNELMQVYEVQIPRALEMEQMISELRELQDKKKLTEEKKQELTEGIYQRFNGLHEFKAKFNPVSQQMKTQLTNLFNFDSIRLQLEGPCSEPTTKKVVENGEEKEKQMGELLKEKLDAYEAYAKPWGLERSIGFKAETPDDVKANITKMQNEIIDLHAEISKIQINRYYEGRFDKKISIKSYDFNQIMVDVVTGNMGQLIERLGFFYSLKRLGKAALK